MAKFYVVCIMSPEEGGRYTVFEENPLNAKSYADNALSKGADSPVNIYSVEASDVRAAHEAVKADKGSLYLSLSLKATPEQIEAAKEIQMIDDLLGF
ncbi:MAG: hypothetical protein WDN46_24200 [Methylocella sp.]